VLGTIGGIVRIATAISCFALALLTPQSLRAQPSDYSDWKVNTKHNGIVTATTTNESGNEFGRICFTDGKSCGWALLSKTACTKGDKFPVLVNSNSGSFQLSVKCVLSTDNGNHLMMFTSSDELDDVSKTDPIIGIAFPLKSGRFLVMRFSMAGSNRAIKEMEIDMFLDDKPSTRDSVL
jgi:hypothetical protein